MKKLPKEIIEFSKVFSEAGYQLYLVGGAVRNMAAGLLPRDYDFTTDAEPENVVKLFKRVIPTGIKHGTVTVLFKKNSFEVTTFRVDGKYSDARRPDSIEYTKDLNEDLKRRDFTINAMAYDIADKKLMDPQNGQEDLKNGIIRAIGNPVERFNEDGLRLLRACRFAAQLNYKIDPETLEGMKKTSSNIKKVSAERIMEEIVKIMGTVMPSISFEIMRETGILEIILPELSLCIGVEQKGFHEFDVYRHSIYACDAAPADNLNVRLAALFHDIGKPVTAAVNDDNFPTFHKHEHVSADMTGEILKRLKFSRKTEEDVCHLIRKHMFNYSQSWTDSAVRRFISKTGVEYIRDLFFLRQADQYGFSKKVYLYDSLDELKKRIDKVLEEDSALSVKDLAVDGKELMKRLNIGPGPVIGTILEHLLETVLDDPSQNDKDKLLEIAEKFYKTIK